MKHCPICGQRTNTHPKLGKVLECPAIPTPQGWYLVSDAHGNTVAAVVHKDMVGAALQLFDPPLAAELGFKLCPVHSAGRTLNCPNCGGQGCSSCEGCRPKQTFAERLAAARKAIGDAFTELHIIRVQDRLSHLDERLLTRVQCALEQASNELGAMRSK